MKRRWKAVAAVLAGGSWLVWSHEDRDVEQLVEDSRWCQYRGPQQCKRSILHRVLGARNRDPIAAGDGCKADREAASQ